MPVPTNVTFHDVERSHGIEAAVLRWVARIEPMYAPLARCHVTIDRIHHWHRSTFAVRLALEVPGVEIATRAEHDNIYVAIADAFRDVRRRALAVDERRVSNL